MKLDELDFKVLNALIENPEEKYRKLAEKINTSTPTIYNRIDKLKKLGIIKGSQPKIDLQKLEYDIISFIQVNIESKKAAELAKKLGSKSSITGVYEVSGPYNLLLIAKLTSTIELKKIIEELAKIKEIHEIETAVAYNVFKEEIIPFPLKKKSK